jgi:hypothetical protein
MPAPVNNDGNSFAVQGMRADQERSRRAASRAAPDERETKPDAAEVTQKPGAVRAESRIQTPELAAEAAQYARLVMSQQPSLASSAQAHASPERVLAALRG